MIFIFVSVLVLFPYVALMLYYRKSWLGIEDYVPGPLPEAPLLPMVSILIAARNEEKNIGNCLRSIMKQSYPPVRFEVIIVDDHSTDRTAEVVLSFQHPAFRLITLSDYTRNKKINSYKKKSIETALSVARGELILTTDADCTVPVKWIETMASLYLERKPVFIAAPVVFTTPVTGNGLARKIFAAFQSLDFMTLQGITGASAQKGFHSMCNGANLAYSKKVFFEVGGFEGIDSIASGDDMLLMHKIRVAHPGEVFFLKSPDSVVQTLPEDTLKDFMNQRVRWASKAGKYKDGKIKAVLSLVYLLNAWMLLLGVFSVGYPLALEVLVISLALKIAAELWFLYPVARFFGKPPLLWYFIPLQPFHILYTLLAGGFGMLGSYRWKERKVR